MFYRSVGYINIIYVMLDLQWISGFYQPVLHICSLLYVSEHLSPMCI